MARHLCLNCCLLIAVGLYSAGLAYALIYYQDDFSQKYISQKYESAEGAKWSVVKGQLQTRKSRLPHRNTGEVQQSIIDSQSP